MCELYLQFTEILKVKYWSVNVFINHDCDQVAGTEVVCSGIIETSKIPSDYLIDKQICFDNLKKVIQGM